MTTAKVICDSISDNGQRITTLVLEYPRIIHSEFMTHRMFSRNASSSRAIPVESQIRRVEDDPFIPSSFGKNKRGMQSDEELDFVTQERAKGNWLDALFDTIRYAKNLANLNVHKQLANRLLEPFSHIQVVVTATEWDNFFFQRLDKNAQPEIQELAKVMKQAMENSTPKLLKAGDWHLPFINPDDINWAAQNYGNKGIDYLIKISVARCARVSYGLNERGWGDIQKDLDLYDMLLTNNHWSPFEHQATPFKYNKGVDIPEYEDYFWFEEVGATHKDKWDYFWSGNFKGWVQNRQLIQQLC